MSKEYEYFPKEFLLGIEFVVVTLTIDSALEAQIFLWHSFCLMMAKLLHSNGNFWNATNHDSCPSTAPMAILALVPMAIVALETMAIVAVTPMAIVAVAPMAIVAAAPMAMHLSGKRVSHNSDQQKQKRPALF